MDDSTPPQSEKDWTIMISVREREGQTRATARLKFGDHESQGVGLSRLSPAERGSAGTGSEQAVAQAVSDLARRLMARTSDGGEPSPHCGFAISTSTASTAAGRAAATAGVRPTP
jgi:hypothetical protein